MKFIELTCYAGPSKRVLLNINNIASIYSGRGYNEEKKEYVPVTVIQETTSADNYWKVTETIDEVIALIDECRNTDKKGDIR
jgi:purine nucleoside permease